jgi:hypothetical protein
MDLQLNIVPDHCLMSCSEATRNHLQALCWSPSQVEIASVLDVHCRPTGTIVRGLQLRCAHVHQFVSGSTQDNFRRRNSTHGVWFQSYEVAVGASGRRHTMCHVESLDLLEQQTGSSYS